MKVLLHIENTCCLPLNHVAKQSWKTPHSTCNGLTKILNPLSCDEDHLCLLCCRKAILIFVALFIFGALFMVIYDAGSFSTREDEASYTFRDGAVEAQDDIHATRGI